MERAAALGPHAKRLVRTFQCRICGMELTRAIQGRPCRPSVVRAVHAWTRSILSRPVCVTIRDDDILVTHMRHQNVRDFVGSRCTGNHRAFPRAAEPRQRAGGARLPGPPCPASAGSWRTDAFSRDGGMKFHTGERLVMGAWCHPAEGIDVARHDASGGSMPR